VEKGKVPGKIKIKCVRLKSPTQFPSWVYRRERERFFLLYGTIFSKIFRGFCGGKQIREKKLNSGKSKIF